MDVNISANTLFHFTNNRNALKSILANGLYVRYSLENFESLISGEAELVLPMTCFCDIPLSQVKRHSNTYGKYAIGLTKNWGMKNQVSPVIYSYPNSTTSNILNKLAANLQNFFNITDDEQTKLEKLRNTEKKKLSESEEELDSIYFNKVLALQYDLSHFVKFIKPYEGKFYRNEGYLEKPVKFYEEREWRFVPEREYLNYLELKDSFNRDYYIDPIKRRAINIKLAKYVKLNFEPKDVRFIIVNKDSEIPEMLEDIQKIFGKTASYNDLKLLGTRLISLEQILEDL